MFELVVATPTQSDWDELTRLAGIHWEHARWIDYGVNSCVYVEWRMYGDIRRDNKRIREVITLEQWKERQGMNIREGVVFGLMTSAEQEWLKEAAKTKCIELYDMHDWKVTPSPLWVRSSAYRVSSVDKERQEAIRRIEAAEKELKLARQALDK